MARTTRGVRVAVALIGLLIVAALGVVAADAVRSWHLSNAATTALHEAQLDEVRFEVRGSNIEIVSAPSRDHADRAGQLLSTLDGVETVAISDGIVGEAEGTAPASPLGTVIPQAPEPVAERVTFAANSATVASSQAATLDRVAAHLQLHSEDFVRLTGHTAPSGPLSEDAPLSHERVEAVAAALEALGVPRDRMILASRGSIEPLITDPDDPAFGENRRVDIRYFELS